jgi:hypothetical protein
LKFQIFTASDSEGNGIVNAVRGKRI